MEYIALMAFQLSVWIFLGCSSVNAYKIVTKCPETTVDWANRSDDVVCEKGKTYHCLRSYNYTYVEMCTFRLGFSAELGCPVFQWVNGSYQMKQTVCYENKTACPDLSNYQTIVSDLLYRYPECLVPFHTYDTNDIVTASSTTVYRLLSWTSLRTSTYGTYSRLTRSTTLNDKVEETLLADPTTASTRLITIASLVEINYTVIALIVGGGIMTMLFTLLAILVIIQCRRIRTLKLQSERSKYMSSVPYNPTSSHPYLEERIYDEVIESSNSTESYVEPNPFHQRSREREKTSSEPSNKSSGSSTRSEPYLEPCPIEHGGGGKRTPSDRGSEESELHKYTEFIDDTRIKKDALTHGDSDNLSRSQDEHTTESSKTIDSVDFMTENQTNEEYDDFVGFTESDQLEMQSFSGEASENSDQLLTEIEGEHVT